MPDAIIYLPASARRRWLKVCAEYCASHGYRVVAVASDWADAVRMVQDDAGTPVVVVGRRDHLPADRPWRIEAVDEHARDTLPSTQRRPHRPNRRA